MIYGIEKWLCFLLFLLWFHSVPYILGAIRTFFREIFNEATTIYSGQNDAADTNC